jgi:hypothetical protein
LPPYLFISARNTANQLYPRALGSLFVGPYDTRDYGGGILTRRYDWASLFLRDINTGTWPTRLGESQMRQLYILRVKVEEDEVGGTCGTNGGEEERV